MAKTCETKYKERNKVKSLSAIQDIIGTWLQKTKSEETFGQDDMWEMHHPKSEEEHNEKIVFFF